MNMRTKFVAVLFGPGRRAGDLVAPGDADCRWRVAATLGRAAAVNDEAMVPEHPTLAAPEAEGRSNSD